MNKILKLNKNYTILNILNNINKFIKNNNIHCSPGFENILLEFKYSLLKILGSNIKEYNNIYNKNLLYEDKKKIFYYLKKRIKYRIPSQYILKNSYYYGLNLFINNNVIIPRSPIGEIIKNKRILKIIKNPSNILDLCTGSCCISILISNLFKYSNIDASDLYNKVLHIAKKNLYLYNKQNINLIKSDLFNNIPINKYDLIITNPPYVCKKNMKLLPAEYKHEPYTSLYAANNGIYFIEKILKKSSIHLNENGILICEVGDNYKLLINKYPNIKFRWIKLKNKNNHIFFIKKKNINIY